VAEKKPMSLAKYLATAGVCARRKAVEKVRNGVVSLNGAVCTNPAQLVLSIDTVTCDGVPVCLPETLWYFVLNKPAGYLTAASNDYGKRTVMELVTGACAERIYPVGRLDCMTRGLLLFSNDGELTHSLTHPSFEVPKVYEVSLERPVTSRHLNALREGIQLSDGPIAADEVYVLNPKNKKIVTIQLHSGRNRIVRRMFEHFGYTVRDLARVGYAGLTLEGIKEGEYRALSSTEIAELKALAAKHS